MGKRSFISITQINKINSSIRAVQRKDEVNRLIQWENNLQKNFKPIYSLKALDFNLDTRIAKIEFLETQHYRTIEKYVTQNYVKHPIYSNVKTKKKIIKKTIKLTNSELENLHNNKDWLIKKFAIEIIIFLENEDLQPSWFIKHFLSKESEDKIAKEKEKHNKLAEVSNNQIKTIENKNKDLLLRENYFTLTLKKLYPIQNKIETKIQKIKLAKLTIFKSFATLFIYNIFVSKKEFVY